MKKDTASGRLCGINSLVTTGQPGVDTQMKLLRLFVFAVAAIHVSGAQETAQVAAPSSEATLHYIHDAWDTLTRSMTDCHSLVDPKVTTAPILYMPAGMPDPPEVQALELRSAT